MKRRTRDASRTMLMALLAVSACSPGAWASPAVEAGEPTAHSALEQRRASARRMLVTTNFSSMALDEDGSLWIWGAGRGHEEGTWPEREMLSATPERLRGLRGVVSLAGSERHSLALLEDGTVLSWGRNNLGELGDGSRNPRNTREPVVGLTDVVAVAAGSSHSLALRGDGTVWAWGNNSYGQLGDGTRTLRPAPVQVPGLTGVVAVAAGSSHSLALRGDGTVWAWGLNQVWTWGFNDRGQLGLGMVSQREPPRPVPGLHGVAAVAAGSRQSLALRRNGTLWAWGNNLGALGTGTGRRPSPGPIVGLTAVQQLASGGGYALALRSDGTVWTWGSVPPFGPTQLPLVPPARVEGLSNVVTISAGEGHSLAVREDGTVWSWGTNYQGELGDGTREHRATPVQVQGLTDVVKVAAATFHSLALRADGTVWGWGTNWCHQIGSWPEENSDTPVQVQGLTGMVSVAAGTHFSVGVRGDGTVWFWGCTDDWWDMGDPRMRQVPGLTDVTAVAADWWGLTAVRSDGTVWQWAPRDLEAGLAPRQVEGITQAVSVSYSRNTLQVLRSDGTVWNLGENHEGERGFPSEALTPPGPSQVPGLTGVVSLAGSHFGAAVHAARGDGTVVGWGSSDNGMLGIMSTHLELTRVLQPCRLKVQGAGDDAQGERERCPSVP